MYRRIARAEYQYQREREAIKDEHSRKREEKANRREEIKKKYGQCTRQCVVCVPGSVWCVYQAVCGVCTRQCVGSMHIGL